MKGPGEPTGRGEPMGSPSQGALSPDPKRWRVPCGLCLELHPVGQGVAVFNAESGDTHMLGRAGADLLARIRRQPGVTERELAAVAAPGAEDLKAVQAALAEFRRLRLIETVPD